jgi:hypothetical protein
MARDFKRLAVEEDICVILLSQLNRSGDRSKEPDLSQMRGSGQIEEACDTAVLVHRPVQGSDTATLLLRKGRNIGTGKCKVQFNGWLCYFSDMEYIGENRFRILKSMNSKLKANDEITITHIVQNYPLLVSEVVRDGKSLGSFTAGKAQGIRFKIL